MSLDKLKMLGRGREKSKLWNRLVKALALLPKDKRGPVLVRWEEWRWNKAKRVLAAHGYPQD